ncbi:MAG: damage-inducible protein DinB [Acidobacteria bacterium]|nr:damage-inducible protein DinB [Acidobacteriota bacterium]
MSYRFLVDTYETERIKTLSVWSMFRDEDLAFRPHPNDSRGRSVHEQMVHQCVSEDLWFVSILGVDAGAGPLPETETRLEFIRCYADLSRQRLAALGSKDDAWWEETVSFFEFPRSRAWVMVRRLTHTAHHRGQQTALLRMLNADLHSTYGPTADTGGLMQNQAPVIYAYPDIDALLVAEAAGGAKARLPGPGSEPPTERPPS